MTLQSYSLVTLDTAYGHFSLHPMIHWWIQKRLGRETRTRLLKKALQAVQKAQHNRDSEYLHAHLDALLENFRTCFCELLPDANVKLNVPLKPTARPRAIMSIMYAWYLWVRHQISCLYSYFQDGHEQDINSSPAWQILYELGTIYRNLGLYDRVENLYQLALYKAWEELPTMHPAALPIVGDLAYSLLQQHHLSTALDWYEWVFWARNLVLGRNHPATTGALYGIGLVLEAHGQLESAWDYLLKAYLGRKRRLGASHAMTLRILRDIVLLVQKMPDKDGAYWTQTYFESVMQSLDHGPTDELEARIWCIHSWAQQQNCVKAKALVNSTLMFLEQFRKYYNGEIGFQSEFLKSIDAAGEACLKASYLEDAIELFAQGIYILEAICNCNPNNASVADATYDGWYFFDFFEGLSRCYQKSGQHHEALSWGLRALEYDEKHADEIEGPWSASKIKLLSKISSLHIELSNYNDALEMAARALYLQQYTCNSRHLLRDEEWKISQHIWRMAGSLLGLHRAKEAIALYEHMLPKYEFLEGECSQNVRSLLQSLAAANIQDRSFKRVRDYLRQLLVCEVQQNEQDIIEMTYDLKLLGMIHMELGEFEEGLALFKAGAKAFEEARGYDVRYPSVSIKRVYLAYSEGLQRDGLESTERALTPSPETAPDCMAWYEEEEWPHGGIERGEVEAIRRICERAKWSTEESTKKGSI